MPTEETSQLAINGQTIPHFYKRLAKQILYIPQAPYIFQDTLANNIRFYTPEATDEAIQQAIQLVGLDELVKDLPEGIHTLIGESGRMLSGDKRNE